MLYYSPKLDFTRINCGNSIISLQLVVYRASATINTLDVLGLFIHLSKMKSITVYRTWRHETQPLGFVHATDISLASSLLISDRY
jgi:hypothetical protein